jgi:hypothetical protein
MHAGGINSTSPVFTGRVFRCFAPFGHGCVTNTLFSRGSGSDRSCVGQPLDLAATPIRFFVDLAVFPIRFIVEPIGYTALVAKFCGDSMAVCIDCSFYCNSLKGVIVF